MAELGPDSIKRPGLAGDQGVRASASSVRFAPATDQVGQAQYSLAAEMQKTSAVFQTLLEKRQDAEDQAFVDKYQLELNKRMTQAEVELTNSPASRRRDFVEVLDRRFSDIQKETYDSLTADNQYIPSDKGLKAANHAAMQLRSAAAKRAVVSANNQRVQEIYSSSVSSVDEIARMTAATGDIEGGLKRVDSTIEGMRSVLAPDKFDTMRENARARVTQMAVLGMVERGELEKAKSYISQATGFVGKGAGEVQKVIVQESHKAGVDPLVQLAIAKRESSFNPAARNENSSASGLFQMISSTSESLGLSANAASHTVEEQARSGAKLTAMNAEALRKGLGRAPQPGEIYLAHFLGDGEALRVLKADPDAQLSAIGLKNAEGVFRANPSIRNWTAGQMVEWASKEMSTQMKAVLDSGVLEGRKEIDNTLPLDTAVKLSGYVQTQIDKRDRIRSSTAAETFERAIIDMSSGNGSVFSRYEIESSPDLPINLKNALLRNYDAAVKNHVKVSAGWTKFSDPNGGSFNPFIKEERDIIDNAFLKLGGDQAALNAVIARTGYIPSVIGKKMRSDLLSSDVNKVQSTLMLAGNVLKANPNTFAGQDGMTEVEKAAIEFQHRVNDLGYTADEAAKHYIKSLTPEYQANVKTKIKGEDLNKIVKDNLSVADIENSFDRISFVPFTNPSVGQTAEQRLGMLGDYEELFRERYLETGDIKASKAVALSQLKRVWGVSNVNGKETVMRYPPEAMPALAGVENTSAAIADQLIADIKAMTGKDVTREKLILSPTFGGETASAYKAGKSAPYIASWIDENGVLQFLNPGKAFIVDVDAIRSKQTAGRESQLRKSQEADLLTRELERGRPPGLVGLVTP